MAATARADEMIEARLPVDNFAEARMLLRRPFTPAAVKWKVQSEMGSRGLIVGYIDARLVIERLNLVVGDAWTAEYEPIGRTHMWCHLTVFGTTRRDVGEGQGKALVSDALKRAAVHFGVGVSLYAIPQTIMEEGRGPNRLARNRKGRFYLSDANEAFLRRRYADWLRAYGIEAFGEPFDHGDAEGSVGDPDAVAAEVAAPEDDVPANGTPERLSEEDVAKCAAIAREA